MTPAKRDERIPQTFAFREFVYGQPTHFQCKDDMSPKEGSGRRTYTPQARSLRARLLAEFAAHPDKLIDRAEIAERYGVKEQSIQYAITLLRRDGRIKTLYGPNRTTFYAAIGSVEMPTPKLPKQPKPIRDWPSSSYTAPKPIANSIFSLAETL